MTRSFDNEGSGTTISLESLIREIQELTREVVGESLMATGSQIADALANLDLLMVHLDRRRYPREPRLDSHGGEPWETPRELLEALGIELRPIHQTMLALYLGRHYRREGRWDEALVECQRAHSLAAELEERALQAESLKEMGHIHSERSDWAAASEVYGRARELYEQLEDTRSLAEIQKNEAVNRFQRGDYSEAHALAHELLETAEHVSDDRLRADVYTLLGAIYDARGEFEQAVANYRRSIIYCEQNDDPAGLAQSYHNLGLTLTKQGLWQEAGEAYEQSMQVAQAYGNKPLLASVWFNRAMLYFELHDLLMAQTYCEESLQLFESLNYKRGMANAYRLHGMIQAQRGSQGEQVRRSFRVALRLAEDIEDLQTQAEIMEAWGAMEMDGNERDRARQLLEQALEKYRQIGATDAVRRLESLLDDEHGEIEGSP